MAEIIICSNCKKSISEKEVRSGLVLQQDTKTICPECSRNLGLRKGGQDENSFILQSILNDTRNISRVLTYEKSTWLNIAGSVVQCFVFGVLIFACVSKKESVNSVLLLAVVLQVMALTLFVAKK
ncbi:MAG: hypothetical protein ACUZ8E_16875 [Candidatus Anammoxibacter sp.]